VVEHHYDLVHLHWWDVQSKGDVIFGQEVDASLVEGLGYANHLAADLDDAKSFEHSQLAEVLLLHLGVLASHGPSATTIERCSVSVDLTDQFSLLSSSARGIAGRHLQQEQAQVQDPQAQSRVNNEEHWPMETD
jgi:hypothetical protein